MFLVTYTYENNNVVSNDISFKIISQYHTNEMFVELYESMSDSHTTSIDSYLFQKMIKHLSNEETIQLFNSICNYKICEIYKNVEPLFVQSEEAIQ